MVQQQNFRKRNELKLSPPAARSTTEGVRSSSRQGAPGYFDIHSEHTVAVMRQMSGTSGAASLPDFDAPEVPDSAEEPFDSGAVTGRLG